MKQVHEGEEHAGRVGDERMMDWLGCLIWWLRFRFVD